MEKLCTCCNQQKPLERFSKKKGNSDGLSHKCKDCHNTYVREVWYKKNKEKQIKSSADWRNRNPERLKAYSLNVNLEEVIELFKTEKKCFICSSTENICLDHCHVSNNVRGWLCNKCNFAIGLLGDTIEKVQPKLKKIVKYLKQ